MCLAVMLTTVGQVQAEFLTFDNVPLGSLQNEYGDMPTYKGFNFSSTLDWIDTVDSTWNFGAHSGDFTLLNNYGGIGVITAVGDVDFTFDGLWAKKWNTPAGSGGSNYMFGVLSGFNDGLLVWAVSTSLNGSFQYFGAQSGAIDELQLGFGDYFLVDDIELNSNIVPEPASMALWGIGALGIGLVARRRKKQSDAE